MNKLSSHQLRLVRNAITLVGLLLGGLWISSYPLAQANLPLAPRLLAADEQPGAHAADTTTPPPPGDVTIIEANEQSLVLELMVGEPIVENVSVNGEIFQRLILPNPELTDTSGAPQVPMRSMLLGVPTTEGLALEVLVAEPETRSGFRLQPAPQYTINEEFDNPTETTIAETFTLDAERYSSPTFYPGQLATLGETGYMRDQAVVRVTFYPVQYQPVRGDIQFYRRLRVRLTWPATVQAAATGVRGTSVSYEELLRSSLLNYASLRRSIIERPAQVNASNRDDNSPAATPLNNAEPQLKIEVNANGLYQITFQQLADANFNPGALDPRRLQLTNRGQAVPLYVQGEEDGRFDPTDSILFYGTAIAHDIYTITNVYWLAATGNNVQRMGVRDGAPSSPLPPIDRFPTTVHAEKDTVYWSHMLHAQPGEDRWFWDARLSFNTLGYPDTRVFPIPLHGLAHTAGETANLRVRLKGYTATEHQVQLMVNQNPIPGVQSWSGQSEYTYQAVIPAAWLKEGDNLITVKLIANPAMQANTPDSVVVNWFEIDHWRNYAATADALHFTAAQSGRQHFQVTDFSTPAVTVLDISEPRAPVRILNATVQPQGGRFQVNFQDEAAATKSYLAVSAEGYSPLAALRLDKPSDLHTVTAAPDYIIITAPEFYASAEQLANHRRQYSRFNVQLVQLDDIYDEFNFGIANPAAIRAFLTYVYTKTAPLPMDYVLLFGDATVDYRGNLNPPTRNFVPTQIVSSTLFGEVPSDNWFVAVAGDDIIPEMHIGRLTATNVAEAERMVARIKDYDNFPPGEPWNKQILFVADDDESKFADNSDELATTLPLYGYAVDKVYLKNYQGQAAAIPRGKIIDHINDGAILVNYFGHGTHFGWGITQEVDNPDKYIFHNHYIPALNNRSMLPVVTIANCLNGAFAGTADRPALAELLQRSDQGGAIAVWAPSSLGYPTGHKELLGRFYEAIFFENKTYLGAAATSAKIGALNRSERWAELVRTYILFGDPATALGIPRNEPYVVDIRPAPGNADVAFNRDFIVQFSKPMSLPTLSLITTDGKAFRGPTERGNRTYIFGNPGLAYASTYQVTLRGLDLTGNRLITGPWPIHWSFTTELDLRPRAIVELAASVGIARPAEKIRIRFTEPILPSSLDYAITPGVRGLFVWSADGTQAEFEHANFQEGQTYIFRLNNARDVTNNPLAEPVTLTFSAARAVLFFPQIGK